MFTQRQSLSEDTVKLIDSEIRRFVTEGQDKARRVIAENKTALEAITQALMEYETITGEECKAILRGEKIVRKDDDGNASVGSAVPTAGRPRPRGEPSGGFEPQPTT
jgi:cell division protease FtsH